MKFLISTLSSMQGPTRDGEPECSSTGGLVADGCRSLLLMYINIHKFVHNCVESIGVDCVFSFPVLHMKCMSE